MGMVQVEGKDLHCDALHTRPLGDDHRDGTAACAEIQQTHTSRATSAQTGIQMIRQSPHPAKPAIDAAEVCEALVDRSRRADPLIEPFLAITTCRQPPILSHGDNGAPPHHPSAYARCALYFGRAPLRPTYSWPRAPLLGMACQQSAGPVANWSALGDKRWRPGKSHPTGLDWRGVV
jgi:hypothetical protein